MPFCDLDRTQQVVWGLREKSVLQKNFVHDAGVRVGPQIWPRGPESWVLNAWCELHRFWGGTGQGDPVFARGALGRRVRALQPLGALGAMQAPRAQTRRA